VRPWGSRHVWPRPPGRTRPACGGRRLGEAAAAQRSSLQNCIFAEGAACRRIPHKPYASSDRPPLAKIHRHGQQRRSYTSMVASACPRTRRKRLASPKRQAEKANGPHPTIFAKSNEEGKEECC